MKRPNGTGSITKLKGNRRKKIMVRKTIGNEIDHEKERVVQKQVVIGYVATKKEALQMLENYNANPLTSMQGKLLLQNFIKRSMLRRKTKYLKLLWILMNMHSKRVFQYHTGEDW